MDNRGSRLEKYVDPAVDGLFAFYIVLGILVFASAITLLLYREMNMNSERQEKVEYVELFVTG